MVRFKAHKFLPALLLVGVSLSFVGAVRIGDRQIQSFLDDSAILAARNWAELIGGEVEGILGLWDDEAPTTEEFA